MTGKLLVTGSRDYVDADRMTKVLAMLANAGFKTLVHGGQRGADLMAERIGTFLGYGIEPYPVQAELDGPWPGAGPRRNTRMLEASDPDLCIAFPLPGSKGTWDMANKATKAGVLTLVVHQVRY